MAIFWLFGPFWGGSRPWLGGHHISLDLSWWGQQDYGKKVWSGMVWLGLIWYGWVWLGMDTFFHSWFKQFLFHYKMQDETKLITTTNIFHKKPPSKNHLLRRAGKKHRRAKKSTPRSSLHLVGSTPTRSSPPGHWGFTASTSLSYSNCICHPAVCAQGSPHKPYGSRFSRSDSQSSFIQA